jgi:hypothetical protein
MVIRLLAVALLFTASTFAPGQGAKAPDTSAGPVPPAIQQMPNRFQPPVPGCTDCYYTVPSGKVLGAMGTTNNEGIKVTHPISAPAPPPPAASAPAAAAASTRTVPSVDYTDLVFKSGAGVWPIRTTAPLPLFIGSATGLSRTGAATLTLASACDLHSVEYTTQAGTITTVSIPLSLWDVTTNTKLADLPTDWNSWKPVTYPEIDVGKQLPAGHKLQVRLTQPASSELPVNFQFTISVSAHCLKETKPSSAAVGAKPAASIKK